MKELLRHKRPLGYGVAAALALTALTIINWHVGLIVAGELFFITGIVLVFYFLVIKPITIATSDQIDDENQIAQTDGQTQAPPDNIVRPNIAHWKEQ